MSGTFHDLDEQPHHAPGRWRILGLLLLAIPLVAMPGALGRALYTAQGVSRNAYLTELVLPILCSAIAATAIVILRRTFGKRALGIVWFRWKRSEVAAAAALIVAIPVIQAVITRLIHGFGLATTHNRIFFGDGLGLIFFVGVTIILALITPLVEELFWRGSVQGLLTPAIGACGSWLAQAVLFAAVHLRPVGGFVPLFVFGLLTGLWRWRRQTLLPVILAHVVANCWWCAAQWPNWLDMSRVRIAHDYNNDLVELSRPTPYDPNDDARYDYERAEVTFQPLSDELDEIVTCDPAEWTPEQRDAMSAWIATNAEALDCIVQGASKPYYCPDYQIGHERLPALGAARNLAFALNARTKLHAEERRDEDMVRDVTTLYRFGAHFGGKKTPIRQLTGAAIRGLALTTTRKVLAHHRPSLDAMDALYEEFQAFSDADHHTMDFSSERLLCLDDIQRLFTDDGHGMGHISEAALDASPGMTPESKDALLNLERSETTRCIEAFFERIQSATRESPWELHDDPDGIAEGLQEPMRRNAFLGVLGPALVQSMEIPWRARTELDAVVTILALLRYQADWGQFPKSLAELVSAGYHASVPRDSYSSGALTYKRTDDGFLLYSFGADFDDDGGAPSNWGTGKHGGDQVFWPVQDLP